MIYNLVSRTLVKNLRTLDRSSGLAHCVRLGESTAFHFELGPFEFPVLVIEDGEAGVKQLQVESKYLKLVEQLANSAVDSMAKTPYNLEGEGMVEVMENLKRIQSFKDHDDLVHSYLGLDIDEFGFYRFSGSVAYLYHRTAMGYTRWRL